MSKRPAVRWLLLTSTSLAAAAIAQWLHVPAAWLIAPMVTAIVLASGGIRLRMVRQTFVAAQSILGITIAQTVSIPTVIEIGKQFGPILAVVLTTVAAAGIAGWLLARFSPIGPETAAWGSSPGAASVMSTIAGEFGADVRIVAFMQFLRVTVVVLTASLVTRVLFAFEPGHTVQNAAAGTAPFALLPFLETLVFALAAGFAGFASRIPGSVLLFPLLGGAVLHSTGLLPIDVPWWLLDAAYLTIGWNIGLLYTRETLAFVLRLVPLLVLSTCVLMALCGLSAALLVALLHVDPLTAYLATTPGGLDSVSVIALGSGSDIALVLAMQTVRLFVVLATGPPVAKMIARLA